MPKISFCITCMNRLEHLKKTLPINITYALENFQNFEFVLLDYHSSDGLGDWVQANMSQEIDKQILAFFQTFEPQSYHRSHSRNMAFRLATGDILVNLDADNFIGKGFTKWIHENMIDGSFMATEETIDENRFKDAMGRVCVWKKDFLKVRGYDERMAGYGFEDIDFKTRLTKIGLHLIPIKKATFLKSIKHDNWVRIKNEGVRQNLHVITVRHIEPFCSEVFFFYKNYSYEKAMILDIFFHGQFAEKIKIIHKLNQVVIENLTNGSWEFNQKDIQLDGKNLISTNDSSLYWFYPTNFEIVNELIYTFSALKNKKTYFENSKKSISMINKDGFGKGNVILNFNKKINL